MRASSSLRLRPTGDYEPTIRTDSNTEAARSPLGVALLVHFLRPTVPRLRGRLPKLGSNLGPTTAKLGPKPSTMTQHKARRANKIGYLQLPWAQEVWSSNLHAPTNLLSKLRGTVFKNQHLARESSCA